MLKANYIYTNTYQPQSNGMVERVHILLMEGLPESKVSNTSWPKHLPCVHLNIRTSPKSNSNISAAKMLYGPAAGPQ